MARAIIKIQNCYSWLTTDSEELKVFLWRSLRFRAKNYHHSRLYQQKLWDGFKEFYLKDSGRFLTGLLPEVEAVLKHFNIEYTINDYRNSIEFKCKEIDKNFLQQWNKKDKPFILEDYQVDLPNGILKHKRGIIFAPTSAGKAQPLDAIVHTPFGPRKMGELKIGDIVSTPDGKTSNIIGLFPQGEKDIYKITFGNGDTVECCEDHLWKIESKMNWMFPKVVSLKSIKNNYLAKNGRPKYQISPSSCIFYKKQNIPIDPYTLGAILGDGCISEDHGSVMISSDDSEVIEKIKSKLPIGYVVRHSFNYDYRICKEKRGIKYNFFMEKLREMKLWGCNSFSKFIPQQYKYNSRKIRIQILCGLMDTDGYVDNKGRLEFCSSSIQLIKDTKEIIESLGGVCRIRSKIPTYTYKNKKLKGKRSYTLSFCGLGPEVFSLSRKINRAKLRKKYTTRTIKKIEYIGKKEAQCILIDHPDHLYVTNNCIPTHNTAIMISILKALPENTPALVLCNRQSLVQQNYEELMKWGFTNVGRLYDKYEEPNIITCATVQSIHKMEKLLPLIKVLVVDEIHEMMSDEPKKCYNKLKKACVRVAVSATPFKDGGKDKCQKYAVKGYFGPVMKTNSTAAENGVLKTKKLQERGRLSKSNATFYKIKNPQLPYAIYQDAVTQGIANNWEFHKIVARLAERQIGRTLILVERLEHGDFLKSLMPSALWVQGKDNLDTRKEVIQQLRSATDNVIAIATIGIFNTGVDFQVHQLINAAGGKSEHVIIQRFGRGLRTADDKEELGYYDFIFAINEYLEDHSWGRVKILEKEGHKVEVKEIDF